MPELPEVEAAKRLVDSHCLGAVIVKAIVENDAKVIEGLSPAALQDALTGKKIVSAHRKGKHLWLQLDSPPWPSFQFGKTYVSPILVGRRFFLIAHSFFNLILFYGMAFVIRDIWLSVVHVGYCWYMWNCVETLVKNCVHLLAACDFLVFD